MKSLALILLVMAGLAGFLACATQPLPPCALGDRRCLPCTNPWSTSPDCVPFPTDTKRQTDGGTDRP